MKIGFASDHRGYKLKKELINELKKENYEIIDYGTDSEESTDYPDYAFKLGENVQGTDIKGDKVSIELKSSVPFSKEGIVLKDTKLIEDGVLKAIHGPYNFAEYLGIEPIGSFDGAIVQGGNTSE